MYCMAINFNKDRPIGTDLVLFELEFCTEFNRVNKIVLDAYFYTSDMNTVCVMCLILYWWNPECINL